MKFLIASLTLVISLTSSNLVSALLFDGPCPTNIKTVQNFNKDRYVDTWYEVAKYDYDREDEGRCIKSKVFPEDADSFSVQYILRDQNDVHYSGQGIAKIVDSGKLKVVSNASPDLPASDFWILDTDYTNYSVSYSCQNVDNKHEVDVSIWTREPIPSEEVYKKAQKAMEAQNLPTDSLDLVDQNCEE